jgi:hypothetical protein
MPLRGSSLSRYGSTHAGGDLSLHDVPKTFWSSSPGLCPLSRRILRLGQGCTDAIPIVEIRGAGLLFNVREHPYDA